MDINAALDSLKRLIGEHTLSDDQLKAILEATKREDGSYNVNAAARDVWLQKAAGYAELVDVTEGSSSRKLSSLYSQALAMAGRFDLPDDVAAPGGRRRTTIGRIVRR